MIFRRNNDFEQFSVWGWITGSISRIWQRLLEGLGQDDFDRGQPDGGGFLNWLSFPFRVFWAFLGFLLTTWSSTRPANSFGRAMPALLVTAVFVGILVLAYTIPFRLAGMGFPDPAMRYEARTVYLRELSATKKDPVEKKELLDGSVVCAQHLVSIRPKNDSYKYLLGIALAENGDRPGARSVMQYIAPENEKGMSMAHIWLAFDLLSPESIDSGSESERQEKAFNHLRKIEESSSNNETIEGYFARVRMAALLVNDKRYDEAKELLLAVVESQLGYAIQLEAIVLLANVYKAEISNVRPDTFANPALLKFPGQLEAIALPAQIYKAQFQLDAFVKAVLHRLTDFTLRQPDKAEIWETIVALNVIRDDYHFAALSLRDGIMATRDPEVRTRLLRLQSVLFIRQSESVPNIDNQDDYKEKFLILAKAISVNPQIFDVYVSMLPFLDVKRPNSDEAIWLREIFLDPEVPGGVLHIVVGLRDMLNGRYAEGQGQWLIASRKMETAATVINNLLLVLLDKKPEDQDTIFNLASVAIEAFPDQYVFYYTRAKILKKLNRIDQARMDLELVLEKIPQTIEPKQLMIEIQEELGNTAMVEKLRLEIQEIEAKRKNERGQVQDAPR